MMFGRADVKFLRRELLYRIYESNGEPITIEDLASELDCAYNTVLRHRKALEAQGYITIQTRYGRYSGGSIYEISEEAEQFLKDEYGI